MRCGEVGGRVVHRGIGHPNRHETCGSDNLPEAGKIEVALQKKAERSKVVEMGGEPPKFVGFADRHHTNMMMLSLGAVQRQQLHCFVRHRHALVS
jgi:hypothetical protein